MAIAGLRETQLLVAVPVTEYVVVIEGVTFPAVPVATPLIEYVPAPEGSRLKEFPAHIEPLTAEIVGLVFTDTVMTVGERVFEIQPSELVPVTE
jgi:hypothetical protein